MTYFTKDNFYFDIDTSNQLRITGPENHLLLGLGFPRNLEVAIGEYDLIDQQLVIPITLETEQLTLAIPLVTDIRTLRNYTEPVIPHPTYEQLVNENIIDVLPENIEEFKEGNTQVLRFSNAYEENGQDWFYGSELLFPPKTKVKLEDNFLHIEGKKPLTFTLRTFTNIHIKEPLTKQIFQENTPEGLDQLDPELREFFEQTGYDIEHLIRTKKTSSFEYGTIFPRDWIEAADLGKHDFTAAAIDYMYAQSMNYVNEKGEGWHEEIIGNYKTKTKHFSELIDRKMIDIEPHYILGFSFVSKDFLINNQNHRKLKQIARFIVNNAQEQQYISFKRVSDIGDEYYLVGNWRDSEQAFPRQKSPLSPYDVNCVFYPMALKLIREHYEYFEIKDLDLLDTLIEKWDANKQRFRLYHADNIIGYALALHGKKNLPLPIAHLDESYDLFYGRPSLEEVDSFAKKVIDPEYFYTPVGPILVDIDDDNFNSQQYHGKVIWPKQAAFAVAGLTRQYKYGIKQQWPEPLLDQIKEAVITTSEACFKGWKDLNSVPELYYYDSEQNRARFYTDQESYEGQMSMIQLWSAVGCRRIIRDYLYIQRKPRS